MHWYLSKLVFRIICEDGNHTPQFDEQLRLVFAEDELHALNKARIIGDNETSITTLHKKVCWKFIDVSELLPINEITDGAEIYSKIIEETSAENYIRNTKLKANCIFESSLSKFDISNINI
jgi:Domain of unknown function (DUF4288)